MKKILTTLEAGLFDADGGSGALPFLRLAKVPPSVDEAREEVDPRKL